MVRSIEEDQKVIAGIARLGEIYMRISARIQSAYEEDPKLKFQAARLFEMAGYKGNSFDIAQFLERVEEDAGLYALSPEEKKTLKDYAGKFNDPVLVEEVVWEYAAGSERERTFLMTRIREQLAVFPDPYLGISDLFAFGYRQYDMFPVRAEAAVTILSFKSVKVYGLYEDGGKIRLTSPDQIREHAGMFGVKRSEWINFRVDAFREGRSVEFDFEEPAKEYRIYQIREDLPERRDFSFVPYDVLSSMGEKVQFENYTLVYEGSTGPDTTLEDLFVMFNTDHPADFRGHSLSVSDVVSVMEEGKWASYYVDSFGFRTLEGFYPEKHIAERGERLSEKGPETEKIKDAEETIDNEAIHSETDNSGALKEPETKIGGTPERAVMQKPKTR